MKPVSTAIAAASSLLLALAAAPASRAHAQPTGRAPSAQQLDAIRAHVLQEGRPSVATPAELVPALGAEVPKSVEVFWMPPGVGLNRYRYAVVNRRILVLDNDDRRVVEILQQP